MDVAYDIQVFFFVVLGQQRYEIPYLAVLAVEYLALAVDDILL